ncbi:hypothetical protein BsWGS_19480 [Bradybaena similaris]
MASGGWSHGVLWLKHCLLVIVTVGLETSVTLEVIFMIANIQTLGVPIRYSSLPGTVSACMGIVLIPSMGFIMDRWAKSKSSKALILIGTTSLEILGSVFIFTANTIKLLYYDESSDGTGSTTFHSLNVTDPWSAVNATTLLPPTDYPTEQNVSLNFMNTTDRSLVTTIFPAVASEGESIRYFAILAMIGYCLLDCGYDSSICFVKTFALASTEPRYHSSIIVKSVFVSSFGGCLVAVLGSVGLGAILTAGTTHDGSAAQSAFVAGLCFVVLVSGLVTTLTTGFCCSLTRASGFEDSSESEITEEKLQNEKSPLKLSQHLTSSERLLQISQGSSKNFQENTLSERNGTLAPPKTQRSPSDIDIVDQAVLTSSSGFIAFVTRNKKQILVNFQAFFILGALYSFEVYGVNFVGDAIYKGDPLAPVGSEAYQNYLRGIEVGSQGTLIYYITFTICTSINQVMLAKLGWKLEMLVASSIYVVLNLVCALSVSLYAYYAAAVWTGIFRTVVVTVPYVLANKIALEEGGKDAGVAIAMVAAMLPCGFTVCSAVMGPLIDATGNSATPLYYTAVVGFLGIVVTLYLKSGD